MFFLSWVIGDMTWTTTLWLRWWAAPNCAHLYCLRFAVVPIMEEFNLNCFTLESYLFLHSLSTYAASQQMESMEFLLVFGQDLYLFSICGYWHGVWYHGASHSRRLNRDSYNKKTVSIRKLGSPILHNVMKLIFLTSTRMWPWSSIHGMCFAYWNSYWLEFFCSFSRLICTKSLLLIDLFLILEPKVVSYDNVNSCILFFCF